MHHLYRAEHRNDAADELFGFIRDNTNEGQTARLTFGWGCVHDSNDMAVQGLTFEPPSDPLLVALSDDEPIAREHVALNHRGVVAGRAKFDRAAVPRGTRFSFEIAMWGRAENIDEDKKRLAELVGFLEHPAFRLGGATRRGYGACKIVGDEGADGKPRKRVFHRTFDVGGGNVRALKEALRKCREAPPSDHEGFAPLEFASAHSEVVRIAIELEPRGLWRIGAGDTAFVERPQRQGEQGDEAKPADMLLLAEPWIEWKNGKGELCEPGGDMVTLLIPGASIKGPLVHRILYHYNRLRGRFIEVDKKNKDEVTSWSNRESDANEDLAQLLGLAKSKGVDRGRAARLIVDDCIVSLPRGRIGSINHNRIDRFTQGVMTGGLFAEEAAYGGDWKIELTILRRAQREDETSCDGYGYAPNVWAALEAAVADLCEGRLALGARSMGFAEGKAEWWPATEQASA